MGYRLVGLLSTLTAALVQRSMPVLTALGAWFLLGEGMTIWLAISGCIILFGIGSVQVSGYRSLPISSRPR